jgi:hypothetical protein
MNITELESQEVFLTHVTDQRLPAESLSSIWSTLLLLKRLSSHPERLSFIPSALTITSCGVFNPNKQDFLRDLVISSHETSTSAACSSLLAGHSSENDDFGDIGIFVPMVNGDKSTGVLEVLGLGDWLREGAKVSGSNPS